MKGANPLDRARDAFHKAVNRAQVQARQAATAGWRKSTTNVIIDVPGRPNFIYITKSADQTVTVALNRANVPRQPFLPVWVVLENDQYVVVARDNSNAGALANVPDSDYGVGAHPISSHSDVTLTSLADGEMLQWDATAGRWVNVGIGAEVGAAINAAAADTPLDADKFGFWDAVDSLLKSITWAGFRGLFITFTNKIAVAATATTGAALHVVRDLAAASTDSPVVDIVQDNVGDDQAALRVQQDGTGKLISAFDGASEAFAIADGGGMTLPLIAAKTTPVDADGVLLRDSAASSVVKETTWANIKATLKTYFDTLYGLLGSANTWTAVNTFSDRIDADTLRARDANGLRLDDDGGNLGIFIKDGGNVGIGAFGTNPQGPLHIFDGTGSRLFVTKASVDAVARVVVPDGTGDVVVVLGGQCVASHSGGGIAYTTIGPVAPGGTATIYSAGGNTFILDVAANGEVSVFRTAGSGTLLVTLDLIWF